MIPIKAVQRAVSVLTGLPGVGPRTAQRYVQHLLEGPNDQALAIVEALKGLRDKVKTCSRCRGWDDSDPCRYCSDSGRDESLLMVVASPRDVFIIEESGAFKGRYFVLGGVIAPLEGVGPEALAIQPLLDLLREGKTAEVILGLDPTLEGEATSAYLLPLLVEEKMTVTRLARGIPLGGDLELFDRTTLSKAIEERQTVGKAK